MKNYIVAALATLALAACGGANPSSEASTSVSRPLPAHNAGPGPIDWRFVCDSWDCATTHPAGEETNAMNEYCGCPCGSSSRQ